MNQAKIFKYSNGYEVITVPIFENEQNPMYRGRRVLYLYPWKNGRGYYATAYELLPTLEHLLINKGKIDLKTFSGLISSWDLRKGFVRGIAFSNGVADGNFKIEYVVTGSISNEQIVQNSGPGLPMVTVTGYRPGPNWGTYLVTLTNNLGFSMEFLWDGGSGGNPCEYTGCGGFSFSQNPYDYFDATTVNQISQEMADEQWLDEVKDSTTNFPCGSNTISSFKNLSQNLPALFRNIFGKSSDISITFKNGNLGPTTGASTKPNYTTNNFEITLNTYWNNQTSLSLAATILHEAIHAQLMNWYRQAIRENDQTTQEYISNNYCLYFDSAKVAQYPDLNFLTLMNSNQGGQHQIMTFQNIRNEVSSALLQFATSVDPNSTVNISYALDMSWAGTSDAKGFKDLSQTEKNRLNLIIEGERGNVNVSPNYSQKGKPCP